MALTFDDGPGDYTEGLLDTLERYNAKATFFVLGPSAELNSATIRRMADAGHDIGNHTWHHPQLPLLGDAQIAWEFNRTDEVLERITGQRSVMNRPPYGATTPRVNAAMPSAAIMWSIDTLDWQHRDTNRSVAIVQEQLTPGAIVLFHDIHAPSIAAIEPLLQYFQANDYHPVTVSTILGDAELTAGRTFTHGDAPAPAKATKPKKQKTVAKKQPER